MAIGRRHVDVALSDGLLSARVRRGEIAGFSEQVGQRAAALSDMGNNKNRPRKFTREMTRNCLQRIEAAGRPANDDPIAPRYTGFQ